MPVHRLLQIKEKAVPKADGRACDASGSEGPRVIASESAGSAQQ
jgi:hypothetical protein